MDEDKTTISVELPTRWVNFIDEILQAPGCPYESRDEFLSDCVDRYMKTAFSKARGILALLSKIKNQNSVDIV